MQPDDEMNDPDLDREADAMRHANRAVADRLDERPDPRVRSAVLAAAARQAGSRPRSMSEDHAAPTTGRRWPWSAAALLMVSIGAGLIATRAMRDEPDRVVAVASNATPSQPAAERSAAPVEMNEIAAAEVAEGSSPSLSKPALPRPQPQTRPARSAAQQPPVPRVVPRDADRPPEDATRDANAVTAIEARRKADESAVAASIAPETAPPPSAAPSLGRAALATPMRLRSSRAIEPSTPEAWVERIVTLRADGHDDEADRELDALRIRYPGFTVPPTASRSAGTR